jgi:hypothetical protein
MVLDLKFQCDTYLFLLTAFPSLVRVSTISNKTFNHSPKHSLARSKKKHRSTGFWSNLPDFVLLALLEQLFLFLRHQL